MATRSFFSTGSATIVSACSVTQSCFSSTGTPFCYQMREHTVRAKAQSRPMDSSNDATSEVGLAGYKRTVISAAFSVLENPWERLNSCSHSAAIRYSVQLLRSLHSPTFVKLATTAWDSFSTPGHGSDELCSGPSSKSLLSIPARNTGSTC